MRDILASAASDSKTTRPRRGLGCVASLTTCPMPHRNDAHGIGYMLRCAMGCVGMRLPFPSSHPAEYSLIGTPQWTKGCSEDRGAGEGSRGSQRHRNAARGTKAGQEISQLSNRRPVWWCTAHMNTQGHLSHDCDVQCRR